MINKQYAITTEDVKKFKDMKQTALYKSYIMNIIDSPILLNIANEHVSNIDITDELDVILNSKNFNAAKLNKIFKETIKNTAVNMIADALIIKDIIDVDFENTSNDLANNFKVEYMLGVADKKHYTKAQKSITKNVDKNSILYIGYMEYLKLNNVDEIKSDDSLSVLDSKIIDAPKTKKKTKIKKKIKSSDIDF